MIVLTEKSLLRLVTVISALFIFLLAIVLFISWGFVDTKVPEFFKGTLWGFVETKASDAFDIIAMVGAVVMPHNLYLHTGKNSCCQFSCFT